MSEASPPRLAPVERPKNWRFGLYSLWISAAGLVLVLSIVFYHYALYLAGARFQEAPLYQTLIVGVLTLLLFAEFAAFALGFVAVRLREGKAGLVVSTLALLLLAYLSSLSGAG